MKRLRLTSTRFFLFGFSLALLGPAHAEILVYGTKPKTWSGSNIEEGVKTKWPDPPDNGTTQEGFYFWELDGVDRFISGETRPVVTYQGQTFYPSSVLVNHGQKNKRVSGSNTADGNPESHSHTYYGRAVGPGGKRIFRALYQQWEDSSLDGKPTDTGIGMLEGPCKLISVGGGKTGYYAPKLSFQLWRLDGSFAGSIGSFRDGRKIKYSNWPMVLYQALTREINNRSLNKSDAVIFAVGYLFPGYTELDPLIDD